MYTKVDFREKTFNSGVLAFNTDIIRNDTFQKLKELTDSGRLVVEERNYSVEKLAQVLTKEAVEKLLSDNMLDSKLIEKVMQSEAIQKSLDKNIKLAKELKMQGVPAYIINGKLIPGMIDLDQLKAIVTEIRAAK